MRRLNTHELRTVTVAHDLVGAYGEAIPGFSRHVIETTFERFLAAGRDTFLTPAELGILEGAIEDMRASAGQAGPTVAE